MATNLPDDLLIEILAKLPVESLLRFRSVSKPWKSLLSSPQFISHHTASSAQNHHTVLVRRYLTFDRTVSYKLCRDNPKLDKISDISFPLAPQSDFFTMIGCADGLVCLSDDIRTHTENLFLWNPVLRRYLALPPPSIASSGTVVLGFGPASGDYKLVRIVYSDNSSPPTTSAEVYRLNGGGWGAIRAPESVPMIRGRQASVNGSLHWLAHGHNGNGLIVRFNLESEEFDTRIALPMGMMGNLTIAAWEKSLAVFQVEYLGSFCLWVMGEDGVSWTRRFVVESCGMLRRVRSLRRSGEIVFEANANKLVVFHPQTNLIRQCEFEVEGALSAFHMRSYSESLLLLDHKDSMPC